MSQNEDIKKIVRNKYAGIARKEKQPASSPCCESATEPCCGPDTDDYSVFNDDYTQLSGYMAEADLNLGCGLPTQHAGIMPGHTVLDLGSGAGNDVFVARQLAGSDGRIIGVDFTPEMITKANTNKEKLGFTNIDFKLGDIENLPVESDSIDVVISNCVLNLVPDKNRAFVEIYRVLRAGGHFCVSDVVFKGEMSDSMRRSAELYAGCVSGALEESGYLNIIKKSGFEDIGIKTKKRIELPQYLLDKYLHESDLQRFKNGAFGLYSITVTGTKPNLNHGRK